MGINRQNLHDKLSGFYPNHSKLTPAVIGEIETELNGLNVTDSEFSLLLTVYRRDPKKCDWPPMAAKLVELLPKVRSGQVNVTNGDKSRAMRDFESNAILLGWSEAMRIARSDVAQSQALVNAGINEMSDKYACFTDWRYEFVKILHTGDVLGAYEFGANLAEGRAKENMMARWSHFESIGNKMAKTYFPILRPPCDPMTAKQFLQRVKSRYYDTKRSGGITESLKKGSEALGQLKRAVDTKQLLQKV